MKVKIITDSTCDLSKELIEKLDIEVLPLYVNFSDSTYLDGVDIDVNKLYELISEKDELPKTAAVAIPTIEDVFKKYLDEGYDIVYTGISKAMSRTFENAYMMAQELNPERVFPVDSKNLSTGIGLLLLKACKYRDQGLSAREIAINLERDRELVLSQFAIEKMDFLHKGGRCSSVAAFLGTMLKIKPIIAVRDGKMHVAKKPIGKMKMALDVMLSQIADDKDRLDKDHIFVTHSLGYEYAEYLKAKLVEMLPGVDIIETVAGCVISSHCGKGTIGILYMIEN
jgi:DegV family protein with EDD domain